MSEELISFLKPDFPVTAWCMKQQKISWKTMELDKIKAGYHHSMIFDLSILRKEKLARVVFAENDEELGVFWTTVPWQDWEKQNTAGAAAKKLPLDICNNSLEELEQFLKNKLNG